MKKVLALTMSLLIAFGTCQTAFANAGNVSILGEPMGIYNADGVLLEVTHTKPGKQGVGECAVYGDYFYFEALARYALKDFKMFW